MGVVRDLALAVGSISLLTFIALFGHVPRLRKTPVGWAHRFLRYAVPRWLFALDRTLFGGRLAPLLARVGRYLLHERHPLVVAMYLTLVTGSIYSFVVGGWQQLSLLQQLYVILVIPFPYITLYLAANSDPGYITPENHASALRLYPYDLLNFFPGRECSTCHFTKPARSKHCSICKHCIAKHDHHCIWINNCVGLNNTRYFIAFLVATDVLLISGAYLGYQILDQHLRDFDVPVDSLSLRKWLPYFGMAILDRVYVGSVFLLSVLCGILSMTFTVYHLYLIWAGTTTNETQKWADWKDDIDEGMIMAVVPDSREASPAPPAAGDGGYGEDYEDGAAHVAPEFDVNAEEQCKTWPRKSSQALFRIEPGRMDELPRGPLWKRVERLDEVDNIYDLGWWANAMDVIWPGELEPSVPLTGVS